MNGHDEFTALDEITAAVVDGEKISLADVLRHANTNNKLAFVKKAIDGYLIDRAAERAGIKVRDAEVEVIVGRLKDGKGLKEDAQVEAWLDETGLTQETMRDNIRRMIRFGKLKSSLTEAMLFKLGPEILSTLGYTKKGALRDMLFLQWLDVECAKAQIEITLPEVLA
jgi:hypothetical protein